MGEWKYVRQRFPGSSDYEISDYGSLLDRRWVDWRLYQLEVSETQFGSPCLILHPSPGAGTGPDQLNGHWTSFPGHGYGGSSSMQEKGPDMDKLIPIGAVSFLVCGTIANGLFANYAVAWGVGLLMAVLVPVAVHVRREDR